MQGIGDDWVVTMEWPAGVENGGPMRLVIEPIGANPVGGLSSTVLRQVDFRDAIERFREQLAASRAPKPRQREAAGEAERRASYGRR